jgi:membrane-bound serine protease (ClpP class)
MKRILIINFFCFILMASIMNSALSAGEQYALIELKGSVNPIISEYIVDSINKANDQKVQFIIIQMDTPGGLVSSMREIIKAILSSKVPVIVYTYPKGAQAASAGGFIMLAAHIAAMAPGTEIGAMHPVSPLMNFGQKDKEGRDQSGIMEKKVLNDTIAYARSLAQKRKRNVNWAVRAVRDASSSTYIEAKRLGVIDIIADDMDDLLSQINGRSVQIDKRTVRINTSGVSVIPFEMDWKEKFLNFFADPQVVFFLFIIAVVGIGIEFKNPGMIFPGVIGTIAFFIFLMAVRVLPINFAGLALIILAIILFILELKIASYGLLTVGGIISFVVGSMILFDSPLPGFQLPLSTIIGVVIFLLLFIFVVVRSIVRVHAGKVTTGSQGLIGESGVALKDFDKEGKIHIHGEIWNARSNEVIMKGERVIVEDVNSMVLIVRRESD